MCGCFRVVFFISGKRIENGNRRINELQLYLRSQPMRFAQQHDFSGRGNDGAWSHRDPTIHRVDGMGMFPGLTELEKYSGLKSVFGMGDKVEYLT